MRSEKEGREVNEGMEDSYRTGLVFLRDSFNSSLKCFLYALTYTQSFLPNDENQKA